MSFMIIIMKKVPSRKDYVQEYFLRNYGDGETGEEVKAVGEFLAKNVVGNALDCGCGPSPQVWAICVPHATEIHAVDLAPESVMFIKNALKNKNKYPKLFGNYQKIVEKVSSKLSKDYILKQIDKIKSVQQANMTKKLPFPDNYFDTVMSIYSLGVLQNISELNSAIKEMSRVLKK